MASWEGPGCLGPSEGAAGSQGRLGALPPTLFSSSQGTTGPSNVLGPQASRQDRSQEKPSPWGKAGRRPGAKGLSPFPGRG